MSMSRRESLSFFGVTSLFSLTPFLIPHLGFAQSRTSKLLILVELKGGNDGLNTVIPYTDRDYYALRPTLAIPSRLVIPLSDGMGLNSKLSNLARLYESGELRIIQNLGYPDPNLSHFDSIRYWETGGEPKLPAKNGWLIDALDRLATQHSLDAKALYLDNSGDVFQGGLDGYLGPQSLGFKPVNLESRDAMVPHISGSSLLDKLVQDRQEDEQRLQSMQHRLNNSQKRFKIRGGSFGRQLAQVCNIIDSGIHIPVFKVALGGFDTHKFQAKRHEKLLSHLDVALADTVAALKDMGIWNDTIMMTYSEFGRRAKENGSKGTDHGTAAPHFMLGGRISGGLIGNNPRLRQMKENNLSYNMDYRAVYEFVLRTHFGINRNSFGKYRTRLLG